MLDAVTLSVLADLRRSELASQARYAPPGDAALPEAGPPSTLLARARAVLDTVSRLRLVRVQIVMGH